jgi:ribA/ribD-fused uncharacterized protein
LCKGDISLLSLVGLRENLMDEIDIHNVASLISNIENGFQPTYLFFWGHHSQKAGRIGKQCLSQWWPAKFIVDDIIYLTAEHYLMAEKARLFSDEEILSKILTAPSPGEAKNLGRMVKGFREDVWDVCRFEFTVNGNAAKFRQNESLQEFLLETGDKIIVEASPVDTVWGIGLAENDPRAINPGQWKGLNLLGFALMEVRRQDKSSR